MIFELSSSVGDTTVPVAFSCYSTVNGRRLPEILESPYDFPHFKFENVLPPISNLPQNLAEPTRCLIRVSQRYWRAAIFKRELVNTFCERTILNDMLHKTRDMLHFSCSTLPLSVFNS